MKRMEPRITKSSSTGWTLAEVLRCTFLERLLMFSASVLPQPWNSTALPKIGSSLADW
ncbi:hypothetical protein LEMLEM_LOCUS4455, partial [Lemmus lemmus]